MTPHGATSDRLETSSSLAVDALLVVSASPTRCVWLSGVSAYLLAVPFPIVTGRGRAPAQFSDTLERRLPRSPSLRRAERIDRVAVVRPEQVTDRVGGQFGFRQEPGGRARCDEIGVVELGIGGDENHA